MGATVLQKFLENNLLEVKPNDEEFEKLKAAATSLSKSELNKIKNVVKYTLVAIDKDIAATEPLFETIKEYVQKQSMTVLSKSNDAPITTYRAVALEALYTRAINNIKYAQIIWLTASHLLPYYDLKRKQGVVKEFIVEIGNIVEKNALKEWSSVDKDIVIDTIDELTLKTVTVNSDYLKNCLTGALGPWHGEPKNQYAHSNNPQIWTQNFGEIAGTGIKKSIDAVNANQNKNIKEISTQINSQLNKLTDSIKNVVKQTIGSNSNRTQLLWWKEALYSKSLKLSYRDTKTEIQPMIMAIDLCHEIVGTYPISVDYVLRETLLKLNSTAFTDMTFESFLKAFVLASKDMNLINSLPEITTSEGRKTLLEFIIELLKEGEEHHKKLQKSTGIKLNAKVSLSDITVILFHELQVVKLVS